MQIVPTADARINGKGHRDIIHLLREVLRCRRMLPAFSRGQIYYDFDVGKVRIGAKGNVV